MRCFLALRCVAMMLAAGIVASGHAAQAQTANISGTWSGRGTVALPSGNTESVKCRATFTQSGTIARMSATCASSSTRVTQNAELTRITSNRYSGEFHNPEFNINGSIRLIVNGSNSMSASLVGGGGSASIHLSR